jgi:hypothetical protein
MGEPTGRYSNEVAILNQNASFACGFLKSATCPGKAVVAAVAVQTCTPRFSVFGAVGPRPIVEKKVGGMPQTPDRTGMPRAEQAHENWPSKPYIVHASPYFCAATTRRTEVSCYDRGHEWQKISQPRSATPQGQAGPAARSIDPSPQPLAQLLQIDLPVMVAARIVAIRHAACSRRR